MVSPQTTRPGPALRRLLTTGAAAGATVMAVRALTRPLARQDRVGVIDWNRVRSVARARCDEPADALLNAPALGSRYDGYAAELAPLMAAVCQSPPSGFPRFTAIDRRGFIDANVQIVQRLLEPVEALRARIPESRATAMSRALASRYLGEMFGFISKRVLGQYDPVLMLSEPIVGEPPSLYLVESNVLLFERRSGVPGEALRRYLILHELTHAWQFESHPWLREHIARLMREAMMGGTLEQIEAGLARGSSTGGMAALVLGAPGRVRTQIRALSGIQAVMSVLEGYGNFVMHRVGHGALAEFDDLERAFHERSTQRSMLERMVLAVTGMSMKLRQYDLGERFCAAVAEGGGLDLLNRVWEGPEFMPSMAELRVPTVWVERVNGR